MLGEYMVESSVTEVDLHNSPLSILCKIETESLILWRCSCVVDVIVESSFNKNWESAHSLLSCVESIPNMVHERVQNVLEIG